MNLFFLSSKQFLYGIALTVAITLSTKAAEVSPTTAKIVGLTCEFQTNPTAVNTPLPRFGWRTETSQHGWLQTSYQIVAASSHELLEQDNGDLWDSGTVASSSSTYISFGGTPLALNQKVHWKVRVTDRYGKVTAWSDESTFTVVLTGPDPLPNTLISSGAKPLSTVETSQPALNEIYKAASEQIGQITKVRDLGLHMKALAYHFSILPNIEPWINHLNCEINNVGYYPANLPSDGTYGSTQSDAAIFCMYSHWWMTGDTALLQRNWRTLYRYVQARSQADPGSIGHPFGSLPPDTLPEGDPTPPEFIHLATEAMNLNILKDIGLKASNSPYELKFFDKDLGTLKKQFLLQHFQADGSLKYDSLTAYLYALRSGLLEPGDASGPVVSGLMGHLGRTKAQHIFSESPFVTGNILPILTLTGHFDQALALVMAQDRKNLSPPGLAAVSEWLISMVAGIEFRGQGFRRMYLTPRVGTSPGFTSIKAYIDTPIGKISSAWELTANTTIYSFTIPPNMTSAVEIQLGESESISCDGKIPDSVEGVKGFKRGGASARFLLLPGTYDFRTVR